LGNLSVPNSRSSSPKEREEEEEDYLTLEDATDSLSQNISTELPFYGA